MALYRFNRAKRMPPDASPLSAVFAPSPIDYASLPYRPAFIDYEENSFLLDSPFRVPPKSASAIAMAKSFLVTANLTCGSATINLSNEPVEFPESVRDVVTISNQLADNVSSILQLSNLNSSAPNTVSLSILIKQPPVYSIPRLGWTEVLNVRVTASVSGEEYEFAAWSLRNWDDPETTGGPSLNVCGETYQLALESGSDNVSVTGSIAITVGEWLPRVAP
jgi:hypothetical protein